MTLEDFLNTLSKTPDRIDFNDTMSVIDSCYAFTPCAFTNGQQHNTAGQNSGSCKLFAFARLHNLDPQQTLNCFGQYYRQDVLQNPDGLDHQNIRNFMQTGWEGIVFEQTPLQTNTV